jgi:hypothetical protein
LTPEQKNTLHHKRLNCVHVVNGQCGGGNKNGKGGGKDPQAPTLKSVARSIAALGAKSDKFNIPNEDDDDEEESSEEEEGTSNHSNSDLTRQSKKKKCGGK